MKPVYVFDADGVVIKPWGFAHALRDKYRIPQDKTRPFFKGAFQECLLGKVDLADALSQVVDDWGWTDSIDALIDLWLEADDQPDTQVLEKVAEIHEEGYLCCLASNQEPRRAVYIRNNMGFDDYFDRCYFSCDLGVMKPDIAFYEAVTRDLGVPPSSIHFWDDGASHVEGARRAGWHAYLYEEMTRLEVI